MTQPHVTPLFTAAPASGEEWWRGAVIYQIYPRSFFDSNGDGIGDLAGIAQRLQHVAALGADAIWISPFFTSPMADFGYDVADYCGVDPIFGTLEDFDALVARAHDFGIKVTIDLVFAHTSDQHAWFGESRASRDNDKADWYVWADPNPDGTPPNNWQSVFGGPAWTWDARRRQYYYHQFLKEQPQLNVHNPAVQDALLDAMRFWLDRGVDGFRLDALNHAMFDPALRDNPPAPDDGSIRTRSYDFQDKVHSMSHPDVVLFIERIRALCDSYDAIFTVAEVGGGKAEAEMKAFTAGDNRLNSAYGFTFLYAPALTPQVVADTLSRWPGEAGEGWPAWAFENHDAPRAASRWCVDQGCDDPAQIDAFVRMKTALLLSLRGNVILYQGEELGLLQDEVPFHLLQDPEAIANWPLTLSRDGVRTPLPWDAGAPHAGFTQGTPWLPVSAQNTARAIRGQAEDEASLLHFTRMMLALRHALPVMMRGGLAMLRADDQVVVFDRFLGEARVRCAFNLSPRPASVDLGDDPVLIAINGASPTQLPPYGAVLVGRGV